VTDNAVPGDSDLDILACELDKRPRGAPSFLDLQPAVLSVRREQDVLAVEYRPTVATALEDLAAAERLCCPTIGFEVTRAPTPTLRIRATAAQLDIFEAMVSA
jgi:hypothetical protein